MIIRIKIWSLETGANLGSLMYLISKEVSNKSVFNQPFTSSLMVATLNMIKNVKKA